MTAIETSVQIFYWTGYIVIMTLLIIGGFLTALLMLYAIEEYLKRIYHNLPYLLRVVYIQVAKKKSVNKLVRQFKDRDGKWYIIVEKEEYNRLRRIKNEQ